MRVGVIENKEREIELWDQKINELPKLEKAVIDQGEEQKSMSDKPGQAQPSEVVVSKVHKNGCVRPFGTL